MVDTRDLKSLGHCAHTGSSPVSGTTSAFDASCNQFGCKRFSFAGWPKGLQNNVQTLSVSARTGMFVRGIVLKNHQVVIFPCPIFG